VTPQEFVDTIDIPEDLRRVAIVTPLPLYSVSQWMSAVRYHLGINYDSYSFRINPMRLHGFIDGHKEPRLSITYYDPLDKHSGPIPTPESDPGLIFIRELTL
jgi:hypothetical protein